MKKILLVSSFLLVVLSQACNIQEDDLKLIEKPCGGFEWVRAHIEGDQVMFTALLSRKNCNVEKEYHVIAQLTTANPQQNLGLPFESFGLRPDNEGVVSWEMSIVIGGTHAKVSLENIENGSGIGIGPDGPLHVTLD